MSLFDSVGAMCLFLEYLLGLEYGSIVRYLTIHRYIPVLNTTLEKIYPRISDLQNTLTEILCYVHTKRYKLSLIMRGHIIFCL